MTFNSAEIRAHFHEQTAKVRAAKGRYVTPAMIKFANSKVVGIVELVERKEEKRVSPTIIRRKIKSKVFGIAN